MFQVDDCMWGKPRCVAIAAHFINHSCEPKCFSQVIQVEGQKHIIIYMLHPAYWGAHIRLQVHHWWCQQKDTLEPWYQVLLKPGYMPCPLLATCPIQGAPSPLPEHLTSTLMFRVDVGMQAAWTLPPPSNHPLALGAQDVDIIQRFLNSFFSMCFFYLRGWDPSWYPAPTNEVCHC